MKERPIEYCYWVTDQLLAGEYPRDLGEESSVAKIVALRDAGVEVFIDLTEGEDEWKYIRGKALLPYAQLIGDAQHVRFGIPDTDTPKSPEFTKVVLDAIDRHIAEGRTVYVHCLGGVGRTGTIVGCWLARHNGYDGDAALKRLRELWKENPKSRYANTPERNHQVNYVRNWRE